MDRKNWERTKSDSLLTTVNPNTLIEIQVHNVGTTYRPIPIGSADLPPTLYLQPPRIHLYFPLPFPGMANCNGSLAKGLQSISWAVGSELSHKNIWGQSPVALIINTWDRRHPTNQPVFLLISLPNMIAMQTFRCTNIHKYPFMINHERYLDFPALWNLA